jgi:hypothetical protein
MDSFIKGGQKKSVMFQCKNTPYGIVPWEVRLMKVFFWHTIKQDTNYAYPIEGVIWELI